MPFAVLSEQMFWFKLHDLSEPLSSVFSCTFGIFIWKVGWTAKALSNVALHHHTQGNFNREIFQI